MSKGSLPVPREAEGEQSPSILPALVEVAHHLNGFGISQCLQVWITTEILEMNRAKQLQVQLEVLDQSNSRVWPLQSCQNHDEPLRWLREAGV